jgi:hypothetical protein
MLQNCQTYTSTVHRIVIIYNVCLKGRVAEWWLGLSCLFPFAGKRKLLSSKVAAVVCRELLAFLQISASFYAIGRTKIFLRAGVLGRIENLRAANIRFPTSSSTPPPQLPQPSLEEIRNEAHASTHLKLKANSVN